MSQDHKEMPREISCFSDGLDGNRQGNYVTPRGLKISHAYYILRSEYDNLQAENERLREALQWYVENDDTCEAMEGNEFYVNGLNKAREALEGK